MDLTSTAQLLGNFGEFLGAIAVVITLGYLTVQIRQSKQSLQANMRLQKLSMRQQITEDSSSLTMLLASSESLNAAYTKIASTGERLTDNEVMAYSTYLSAVFLPTPSVGSDRNSTPALFRSS